MAANKGFCMIIKIKRSQKIAKCGKCPQTFSACLARISTDVISKINSKELAALIDAMHANYNAGHSAGYGDAQ